MARTLALMESNLAHPGLRVKKVKGTEHIWEARINRPNRVTFHWDAGVKVLRFNCRHDVVFRNP